MYVSHETIYKTAFIQTRGALKKELQKCLRSKRVVRKSRQSSLKRLGLGKIPDAVSIMSDLHQLKIERSLVTGKATLYVALTTVT